MLNVSLTGRVSGESGIAGKLFATFVLMIFGLVGLFFISMMGYFMYKSAIVYFWQETHASVVSSAVEKPSNSEQDHTLKLKYSYSWKNKTYSGTYEKELSYKEARDLQSLYPFGKKVTCYVNSGDPHKSALFREFQWVMLPFLLIPLVFVFIGFGGVWGVWSRKKQKSPAASGGKKEMGRVGLFLFFGVFFAAGALFGYFFFVRAALNIMDAAGWPEVPCKIVSSRVTSSSDSDGTTYGIEIIYSYKFDDREYIGDEYDFLGGTSSGYKSKAVIVRRYRPGTTSKCYVNPEKPDEAVLFRDFHSGFWFAVIPAVFILVGLGGMIGVVVSGRRKHKRISGFNPAFPKDYSRDLEGRVDPDLMRDAKLKPERSPLTNFLGMTFFALVWNGLVSVFVYQAVKSWFSNDVEWFLTFFIIPFVLIGLATLFGVIYTFFGLFTTRPSVIISNLYPQLGDTVSLRWEIPGARLISKMKIFATGSEEAVSNQGKNNSTRKSTFAYIPLVETDDYFQISAGSVDLKIPLETMHSFEAKNNKIIWRINLYADIRFKPNIRNTYRLHILPADSKEGRL